MLIVATLIIASVTGVVFLVNEATQRPQDAYAMQAAGELVIAHLKLHTNQRPRNWHGLSETFAALQRAHVSVGSPLEQIQQRIEFDWNADVSELKRSAFTNGVRPFRVVKLRNGRNTHWVGVEPNAMIWQYLQSTSPMDFVTNSIVE